MLANLLPGIRDLRTPLATGYLWLLTLWLWIPSHFKHVPPTTGVPEDITRLAHYTSRVGVGIAISFAAYLVGVLSRSLGPPLVRLGVVSAYFPTLLKGRIRGIFIHEIVVPTGHEVSRIRIRDFWGGRSYAVSVDISDKELEELNLAMARKFNVVTGRLGAVGIYSLDESARRAADEGMIDKDAQSKYNSYLLREVPGLGNALVGKEPELYSVYDRLVSEYEFRIGIGAPLIALTVTLATRWSLLWLLVLLPVLVLLAGGSHQRMAAGDLLADAFRLKRIDVALPQELAPASTNRDDFGSETKKPDANADQIETKPSIDSSSVQLDDAGDLPLREP